MAGTFFFDEPVGILPKSEAAMVERTEFRPDVNVRIKLAQNGFKLHYEGKDFVANTLDEAMEMTRKWFEEQIALAKKNDKKK